MKWIRSLYIGEGAEPKAERIRRGIKEGRLQWDVYVLLLAEHTRQLELISSFFLRQSYYRDSEDFTVVGFAKGEEEAQLLVAHVALDAISRLGEPDLYRYLALLREEEAYA